MKRSPLKRKTRLKPHSRLVSRVKMKSRGVRGKRLGPMDRAWSKAIKERDRTCRRCGATRTLEAAHILGKAAHPDHRWIGENGVLLCHTCHAWAHGHPVSFRHFLQTVRV